ncbi:hypothetical protein G6514_009342 [Epicoccum nigrum]|nr:hypothetical protein G6514_009342 [Epicoccum nigrum]
MGTSEDHEEEDEEVEDIQQKDDNEDVSQDLDNDSEEEEGHVTSINQEEHLPPQILHENLGKLVDAQLDKFITNATEITSRHQERTFTRAYRDDLLTLGIDNVLHAPPRTVQKRLTKIVQEPERSREEVALAGRLLEELDQEIEEIDLPRHEALKNIVKVRDKYREVPDSIDECRRGIAGKVEGFSL